MRIKSRDYVRVTYSANVWGPLRFVTSILKSVVFLAISLSLSSVIYSQITLFFALNHTCSKSHHLYCESLHFCSKSHHFCFAYKMRFQCVLIPLSTNLLLENSGTNWILGSQNVCNKMVLIVIELLVQFWSAIILGSNHAFDFRPNHSTPLRTITIINALDLRLTYRWQKIISIT